MAGFEANSARTLRGPPGHPVLIFLSFITLKGVTQLVWLITNWFMGSNKIFYGSKSHEGYFGQSWKNGQIRTKEQKWPKVISLGVNYEMFQKCKKLILQHTFRLYLMNINFFPYRRVSKKSESPQP